MKESSRRKKLSKKQIDELLKMYDDRYKVEEIAVKFGISSSSVYNYIRASGRIG